MDKGNIEPKDIVFDDMMVVTAISENGHNMVAKLGCDDAKNLKDIENIVAKSGQLHCSIITVIAESPMTGTIYRYGNYGLFWDKIGQTKGYA